MNKILICIVISLITFIACDDRNEFDFRVEIPEFNFPKTVVFEDSLSTYHVFQGTPADLSPAKDFHLLELSAVLFTDYAHKQRLVKIPYGTKIIKQDDGTIDFPDGTILTKTFFYYNDDRDTTLGKRIIETRLLVKKQNTWNAATYVWNEKQNDAILRPYGEDTKVSWIDSNGNITSTIYHVPDENECLACHQSNSTVIPLGTRLRNLNRTVVRDGLTTNQISYLQSTNLLNTFPVDQISQIVDYNNEQHTLAMRGRAYLDLNCAHCHHPTAWEAPTEREFDFRYETPLQQTGILFEKEKIREALLDEEMPFIGTTVLDREGVSLVIQYLESL